MKISELIQKLEAIKENAGDVPVTISCDPETNRHGNPVDDSIHFMEWQGEEETTESLMLCDQHTFAELGGFNG